MIVEVNFVTVLLVAVVSMAIGFVWYSPMLFGSEWMKLMGHTDKNMKAAQKEMGKLYALSFLGALVTAFVLKHFVVQAEAFFGVAPLTAGLSAAFWGWLGLVMPVQLTDVLFGGKKWKLFGINTGYQLASLLAMGAVFGILG